MCGYNGATAGYWLDLTVIPARATTEGSICLGRSIVNPSLLPEGRWILLVFLDPDNSIFIYRYNIDLCGVTT